MVLFSPRCLNHALEAPECQIRYCLGNVGWTGAEYASEVVKTITDVGDRFTKNVGMYSFDVFTFKSKRLADVKERATSNRYIPKL